MLLKYVTLQNIRSYVNQHVEFKEGKTLLAGDIGSGKTTILLAIEFALFGILKGTTSGATLLRQGASFGSVELGFGLEGKEYTIKRTLKRIAGTVTQDVGYITINGMRKDLSSVELKSEVLELLGYPKDLLTKSKALIYRYTVYTPQEEMKHILMDSPEERLEVLRRVFGIDTYKRIRENGQVYARNLGERIKILQARTEGIQKKQDEARMQEASLLEKRARHALAEKDISLRRALTTQKREELARLEDALKKQLEQKRARSIQEVQQKHASQYLQQYTEELTRTEREIATLAQQTQHKASIMPRADIQKEYESLLTKKAGCEGELALIRRTIIQSKETIAKIASLSQCPLCKQNVTHEHKEQISAEENSKHAELSRQAEALNATLATLQKSITEAKTRYDIAVQEEKKQEAQNIQRALQMQKERRVVELTTLIEQKKQELERITATLHAHKEGIHDDLEPMYDKAKREHDQALTEERRADILVATLQKECDITSDILKKTQEEITRLAEAIKQMDEIKQIRSWILEHFLPLMSLIEQQVFLHVYAKFNELFTQWFGTLIEDELLQARLDENFTPVIDQNGYQMDYQSLSGGEKTSLALAYRLALNKVINDMMTSIKTHDLLILDEPTDGFSDEQLDRMRDVLDELALRQVIIVSHEAKMESFVDHVARIEKKEHSSRIEVS